ncbi:MAG: hypothetical protein ABIR55_00330 [Burkholderiaceae bacterium]
MLVVMQAPAPMFEALCEHTCALAPALEHVESAHVVSRHVSPDGLVVCVQRWRARATVPQLLQPHLEDGLLDWTLTFERQLGTHACRWHADSAAIQVPGHCHGTLELTSAAGGRGTRIDLHCDFAVTHEGLRTIFGSLLARHWRGLADAAARHVGATLPAN